MPPNPRVVKAFHAMKAIGIAESKVKPVLKSLLKLYDKNWELIEEENYRALADAIFENEEVEAAKPKEPENNEVIEPKEALEEETAHEEPERPLKRLRLKYQEGQSSPSSLKKPKLEVDQVPNDSNQSRSQGMQVQSRPINSRQKGKQPVVSPNTPPMQPNNSGALALIIPKNEPVTDDMPLSEAPIAFLPPDPNEADAPNGNLVLRGQNAPETLGSEPHKGQDVSTAVVSDQQPSASSLEIVSSPFGEVKISLNCASTVGGPDFQMPSLETLLKYVEDKCLRSYKILDPNFSVKNLMRDMCESVVELATKPCNESQETPTTMMAAITQLEASLMDDDFGVDALAQEPNTSPPPSNGVHEGTQPEEIALGENNDDVADSYQNNLEEPNLLSLVPVEPNLWSLSEITDITSGQERMAISVVNEVNSECLPVFHYLAQNVVFQNASVKVSLSGIADNSSCSTCSGDCLLLSTPCACAQQQTSGYAYTIDGLIKDEFLKDCVSVKQDPKKHNPFVCRDCPLERSKNEDIAEPCKGHLARTFIKECWWKCGCNRQCGNRVVQRGISRKLQVFMTSDGKGWGLRTLEDLPKGTFVCEYIGEILTNAEFFDRVSRSPMGEFHPYPVLLDAEWGSLGKLKDEEALCLDATYYGNVARFINHRCFDSNLVEIPVELESPDHNYYHLAFFTTRDVRAMEELTWDYGIDFDDVDNPIKAFRCLCGSQFCRNIKRLSRSRSRR